MVTPGQYQDTDTEVQVSSHGANQAFNISDPRRYGEQRMTGSRGVGPVVERMR